MCFRWTRLRGGGKFCNSVVRQGDRFTGYGDDGSVTATFTLRPGNPERL
ncbi:MAG: hypothetical protein ACT4P2_00475 [Pseudomonadota bacterium]